MEVGNFEKNILIQRVVYHFCELYINFNMKILNIYIYIYNWWF